MPSVGSDFFRFLYTALFKSTGRHEVKRLPRSQFDVLLTPWCIQCSPGLSNGVHPGLAVHLGAGAEVVLPLVLPPVGDGEAVLSTATQP